MFRLHVSELTFAYVNGPAGVDKVIEHSWGVRIVVGRFVVTVPICKVRTGWVS